MTSGWQTISEGNPFSTKIKVHTNGTFTIKNEQENMTEILEVNKALANREKRSTSLWGNQTHVHVARIPEELIMKWWVEEEINFYRCNDEDRARLLAKLNDSDYSALRVAGGRL